MRHEQRDEAKLQWDATTSHLKSGLIKTKTNLDDHLEVLVEHAAGREHLQLELCVRSCVTSEQGQCCDETGRTERDENGTGIGQKMRPGPPRAEAAGRRCAWRCGGPTSA